MDLLRNLYGTKFLLHYIIKRKYKLFNKEFKILLSIDKKIIHSNIDKIIKIIILKKLIKKNNQKNSINLLIFKQRKINYIFKISYK